jgi:DNA-binding transcriptional LysR family regulator
MDKLTEMTVFVEVARNNSFSAAARRMRLSPSSISKIITRMEHRLGSRLFNRTTRKLHLTEGGQRFLTRCVDILGYVEEAEEILADDQRTPKGKLTINSSPGFAKHQLLPYLPKFLSQHPELELNLQLTGEKVDLIKEDVDIAIRLGQLENSNLIARKLGESHRIICASPAYIKKFGAPEKPSDLKQHNCLGISTNVAFNHWNFIVARKKQTVFASGNFISDTVDTIHELALKGCGIARLSEFMIGKDINKGKLIPLLQEYNQEIQQIHLVYPHRQHIPAKTKILINYLLGIFTPIPPWNK